MPIDFRKARKSKRVAIVESKPDDLAEVYIGSAFLPFKDKGVIIFTEYPVHEKIGVIELEHALDYNSVILWFNSKEAVEKLEKHLTKIKTHYEQQNHL